MLEISNRTAITITPKESFKLYIKNTDGFTEKEYQELINHKHIYLLELSFAEEGIYDIMEPYYTRIFEHELSFINNYKKEWPKNRTINMFFEWFDVQLNDYLYDMVNEPITYDEDTDE